MLSPDAYAAARHRLQDRARRACRGLCCPAGYHLHHWSYRREHWCDVVALPAEHHARLHGYLVYVPEAMCFRPRYGRPEQCGLLDTREKHLDYLARVLALPRDAPRADA